jgi:hypothetical protein
MQLPNRGTIYVVTMVTTCDNEVEDVTTFRHFFTSLDNARQAVTAHHTETYRWIQEASELDNSSIPTLIWDPSCSGMKATVVESEDSMTEYYLAACIAQ